VAPFGISLVSYFILLGGVLLYAFIKRQRRLEAEGKNPLLKASLLKLPVLKSGLTVLMAQYFAIAAIFFVIPVYLQQMLGYDALQTGIRLLPLSIGLIIFTMVGSRLTGSRGPRKVVRAGQICLALGSLFLLVSIAPDVMNSPAFYIGLFIVGAGFGLLASQLGNVNMSAVPKDSTSEVGGLQGTYQNLGTSFGTALAGSIFLLVLSSNFTTSVINSSVDPVVKDAVVASTESGTPILAPSAVNTLLTNNGASSDDAAEVSTLYGNAQTEALRTAMFVVFALSIVALIASRNLPVQDQQAL
jgi:predicted MFS family arabinose efflux permease